jgi:hypothetical protein
MLLVIHESIVLLSLSSLSLSPFSLRQAFASPAAGSSYGRRDIACSA